MLLKNNYSKRNTLLYKMKCMNSRNVEYIPLENEEYDRIQKYNDKKKVK